MANDKAELGSVDVDRLIFFSDAVVAIAMTLLALELPVPTGHTTREFWTSARHGGGHYLAFLISFFVIAAAWSQHHRIMRYAERSDTRIRTLNMAWLLMIILYPFATKLLTNEGHDEDVVHALRFGFYALVQVFASGAFIAIVHHLISRRLAAADTPASLISRSYYHSAGMMLGFGLSIPLFFVTRSAWVLWIVGPLLVSQLGRRRSTHRPPVLP